MTTLQQALVAHRGVGARAGTIDMAPLLATHRPVLYADSKPMHSHRVSFLKRRRIISRRSSVTSSCSTAFPVVTSNISSVPAAVDHRAAVGDWAGLWFALPQLAARHCPAIGDMITKYDATWMSPTRRQIIVDYLVEHDGPED